MRGNLGAYDPDSLLTGDEIAQGYTYSNSERIYPSAEVKQNILRGEYKVSEIPKVAPRRLKEGQVLKVVETPKSGVEHDEERSL